MIKLEYTYTHHLTGEKHQCNLAAINHMLSLKINFIYTKN